ncbi:MAG: tetratricopeptide repeat protein [Alphaproteobacteria bacterium]|nr:tetratricopeptide repeat protein [Alphaproteobacteria bacterium]
MQHKFMAVLWLAAFTLAGSPPAAGADYVLGLQAYDLGNYRKAFTEWLPLALDGNPDAQFNIGFMYANGLGVDKCVIEAIVWYRRAANSGIADAQYNLGLVLINGDGVVRDLEQAARWFFEASLRGHPEAQVNMGMLLSVGAGAAPDLVRAYKWTGLAVAQMQEGEGRDLALNNLRRYESLMTKDEITLARQLIADFDPQDPAAILELQTK